MRLPIAELIIGAVLVAMLVGLYFALRLPRLAQYQQPPSPVRSPQRAPRVLLLFSMLLLALPTAATHTGAALRTFQSPTTVPCLPHTRLFLPLIRRSEVGSSKPISTAPTTLGCGITLFEAAPTITDLASVTFDADGDPLTFALQTAPSHGTAKL